MKLIKTFVLGQAQTNCYLIEQYGKKILVDCGESPEIIIDYCKLNNHVVDLILITHTHFDHIAGLNEVVEYFNVEDVFLPPREFDFVRDSQKNLAVYFNTEFCYNGPREKVSSELVSDLDVELFYISGHSCESIAFYFSKDKVLFSGDSVFHNSVGRSDLEFGNFNKLISGIKFMMEKISNQTKIYPGHGSRTTKIDEIKNNPFLQDR